MRKAYRRETKKKRKIKDLNGGSSGVSIIKKTNKTIFLYHFFTEIIGFSFYKIDFW